MTLTVNNIWPGNNNGVESLGGSNLDNKTRLYKDKIKHADQKLTLKRLCGPKREIVRMKSVSGRDESRVLSPMGKSPRSKGSKAGLKLSNKYPAINQSVTVILRGYSRRKTQPTSSTLRRTSSCGPKA